MDNAGQVAAGVIVLLVKRFIITCTETRKNERKTTQRVSPIQGIPKNTEMVNKSQYNMSSTQVVELDEYIKRIAQKNQSWTKSYS